jgi:glycosyltransferase involved in cell wall biosynthesis
MLEERLATVMGASERPVLLLIGAGSLQFQAALAARHPSWAGRVHATGFVPSAALGRYLEACDLLVQPYPDGITSRRTSVMTCLSLGRPVVTTSGHLTESWWRESGAVVLANVADAPAFGAAALRLLQDPELRRRTGQTAQRLYRSRFTVGHVVDTLRAVERPTLELPSCA